jgi:aspartyl-tRNA(Asn)/glutamyl-tRNA(Gln) amidotransferase subunit B
MKIGLECHVQLRTDTKMFCGCANRHEEKPNTLTCEYCLGHPGSKPVLNEKAVEAAIKIGFALNCKFPKDMFFSRKSYFYPDMGKNFQITQYEVPVASEGKIMLGDKQIGITRVQMEEDPARIVHDNNYILVDYNRSGVPLCEIVTEPDFSTPQEARAFLQHLTSILEYLGVMDPSIEGSMRADANISMGSKKVEVKNITGFKEVERALTYESIRQKNLIARGHEVELETRGWDAAANITRSQRSKEEEDEYGYIFEPDLPRISLTKEMLEGIKKTLPEMAEQKIKRYKEEFGISNDLAKSITSEIDLAQIFEEAVKQIDPIFAAKWFAGYIKKTLNYNGLRIKDSGLKTEDIVTLLSKVKEKSLTERNAELIFRQIVELASKNELDNAKIKELIEGSKAVSDTIELEKIAKEVISANEKAVEDYRSGNQKSFNFLVGQVMAKTKGRAQPDVVKQVMENLLNNAI